jgi:hypothetical protein
LMKHYLFQPILSQRMIFEYLHKVIISLPVIPFAIINVWLTIMMQIKNLKYLSAMIDEGLWMFVTNTFGLPRVVAQLISNVKAMQIQWLQHLKNSIWTLVPILIKIMYNFSEIDDFRLNFGHILVKFYSRVQCLPNSHKANSRPPPSLVHTWHLQHVSAGSCSSVIPYSHTTKLHSQHLHKFSYHCGCSECEVAQSVSHQAVLFCPA